MPSTKSDAYHNWEHNNQPIEEKWKEEFRLLWGLAPEGTLKWNKGKDIESFIENLLEQERRRMSEEVKESCSCSSHVDGCSGKTYIDTVISIINK